MSNAVCSWCHESEVAYGSVVDACEVCQGFYADMEAKYEAEMDAILFAGDYDYEYV